MSMLMQMRPAQRMLLKCSICSQYIEAKRQALGMEVMPGNRRGVLLTRMGFCPSCTMTIPDEDKKDVLDAWHNHLRTQSEKALSSITVPCPTGGALPFDWS